MFGSKKKEEHDDSEMTRKEDSATKNTRLSSNDVSGHKNENTEVETLIQNRINTEGL